MCEVDYYIFSVTPCDMLLDGLTAGVFLGGGGYSLIPFLYPDTQAISALTFVHSPLTSTSTGKPRHFLSLLLFSSI